MFITKKIIIPIVFSVAAVSVFQGCAVSSSETACKVDDKREAKARKKTTKRARVKPTVKKRRGISSWYSSKLQGKKTSSGEKYDIHAKTAAHKTLPMQTKVKVINLENGKSTIVRINDRGPFIPGRIIDCSYAAAKEIGLVRMGIAKVQIEVLDSQYL